MKETHRSFMRSGMGALLLMLLLLTACVGEELQKPLLGEGEGYLTLQIGAISAEVTSSTLTKATTQLDASIVPSINQLTIKIKNKDTDEVVFTANPTDETITKVLKTGTYIVEAYHGPNNDIQNTPYFYESDTVEVKALQTATITIVAKLANAMIIPVVTDSLKRHYNDDWTLTASTNNTAEPFPLTFTNGTCTFYAKAGETVSLNFKGTNKAGETADATWKSISNVEACKAYTVECKPDLAAFYNIQVTATATHTKDASNYLNGTEVTFSADLHGANEKAIDSWTVKVCKSDGQIIRTYTGKSLSSMTYSDTDWPYIPQGSTLSTSVKLKAGDEITVGSTFALQPPTFEVKVTGTTSYDLYKAEKISEANGMDAGTIKGIGAKAKIANALLSNPNYSHTFTLTYGDDKYSSETDTITVGDKTGQSWGNHPITATMVFDGQSIEAKKDCHITGLPYTLKHPANNYGWVHVSGYNVKFNNNYIQLATGATPAPSVKSPTFNIPLDINVTMRANVVRNKSTFFGASLHGELRIFCDSNNKVVDQDLKSEAVFNENRTCTMTNNTNTWTILYNYIAAGPETYVYEFTLNYR